MMCQTLERLFEQKVLVMPKEVSHYPVVLDRPNDTVVYSDML